MVHPIVIYDSSILRQTAQAIKFPDSELDKLVADMFETMYAAKGAGLAATQIGVNKKVVVIDEVIENERFYQVLINPIIRLYSRNLVVMQEACLSIPGISANVSRPLEVELEWQDVDGSTHKEMYTGFKARIIQHEVDHLKGILYIDRVNLSDRMKLFMALEHIKNKNVNPIYEIK